MYYVHMSHWKDAYVHICIRVCMYSCIDVYRHTDKWYMYRYIYIYIYAHICTCFRCVCVYVYIPLHLVETLHTSR